MASSSVNVGASSVEQLQKWLQREDSHAGAIEELDWLVAQVHDELSGADPQRHQDLATQLAAWAAAENGGKNACAALRHACSLALEGGDGEGALIYCERALARDPTDGEVLAELEQWLTTQGDFARLEGVRSEQVERLEEQAPGQLELRVEALRSVAALRAERLRDLDGAIAACREALRLDPADAHREALAIMYQRRGQQGDTDAAAELYFALAQGAEPGQAMPWLEQVLDLVPYHEGAQAALERLSAPAALGRALAEADPESVATSTLPYTEAHVVRPTPHAAAAAAAERWEVSSPRTGGTLPFAPQTPVISTTSDPRDVVSERPSALRLQQARARRRLTWIGSAGLVALILFALLTVEDEPSESAIVTPKAAVGTSSSSTERDGDRDVAAPLRRPSAGDGKEKPDSPPKTAKSSARSRSEAAARKPPPRQPDRGRGVVDDKPRPPRGKRIGGVMMAGSLVRVEGASLDHRALMGRLRPVQRKLARCYRRLRRQEPRAAGLIEYAWQVDPRGRARNIRPLSGSLEAHGVRLCGIRALRAARYPRAKGGLAEVRAVFDFEPPG